MKNQWYFPVVKMFFLLGLLIPVSVFSQKKNILIVSDTWPQMHTLAEGILKDGNYTVEMANEGDLVNGISNVDFVFMFIHETISSETEHILIDYTMNGGWLIVLHHGISSSNMKNPEWLDFLGVELFSADHPEYPWKVIDSSTCSVVNLSPGHFITSKDIDYAKTTPFDSDYDTRYNGTYRAFLLKNTEVFLNQRLKKDPDRKILLGFRTEDGKYSQPTSGWYSKKGEGMLFYYQPGHAVSDFQNPNFLRILLNTLEWDPDLEYIPWNVTIPDGSANYITGNNENQWYTILPDDNLKGWTELPWPPGNVASEESGSLNPQWFVNDGKLLCTSEGGHAHLVSDRQFGNFILHIEWRYLPQEGSQNSGIFVRMKPGKYVMHQCELKNSTPKLFGGVMSDSLVTLINSIEPSENGSWINGFQHVPQDWSSLYNYSVSPEISVPACIGKAYKRKINKIGEWNTTEILCKDQFIVIWNNGSISSYTDNCTVMVGSLGIESEGHAIEFRNMMIRELE